MQRRAWLCVAPLIAMICDVTLTLHGQDACYWQGDYDAALESNPLARPFLACHPLLFLGGAVVYGIAFSFLLCVWRHRLGVVLAFFLTLSHAIGSATWLARQGTVGWIAVLGLFLALERIFTYTVRRAGVDS